MTANFSFLVIAILALRVKVIPYRKVMRSLLTYMLRSDCSAPIKNETHFSRYESLPKGYNVQMSL